MTKRFATFTLMLEIHDESAVYDGAFDDMIKGVVDGEPGSPRVIKDIIGSRDNVDLRQCLPALMEKIAFADYPGLVVLDYECKVDPKYVVHYGRKVEEIQC